jgi:hypothetical protein
MLKHDTLELFVCANAHVGVVITPDNIDRVRLLALSIELVTPLRGTGQTYACSECAERMKNIAGFSPS